MILFYKSNREEFLSVVNLNVLAFFLSVENFYKIEKINLYSWFINTFVWCDDFT